MRWLNPMKKINIDKLSMFIFNVFIFRFNMVKYVLSMVI